MSVDVVLLGGGDGPSGIRRRSEQRPCVLFVEVRRRRMARGGVVVDAPPLVARFILALVSRPGALVPREEIEEALWGDRADGGPLQVGNSISAYWSIVQVALVSLGYAGVREWAQGFRAWPLRLAAPGGGLPCCRGVAEDIEDVLSGQGVRA